MWPATSTLLNRNGVQKSFSYKILYLLHTESKSYLNENIEVEVQGD